MLKKFYKILKNPKIIFSHLLNIIIFNYLTDDKYLQIKFKLNTGRKLDLINPKTFNEKLQWLKLNDRNPQYTILVDKYEVRKYIEKILGKSYLIPLIGVWNKFEDIDFSKLPDQFVLKCTHNSGGNIICKDKSKFDIKKARKKINKNLNRNYYYRAREWPYKNVKPKIVCEKYIVDESGDELKDYKIFCFNGEPKIIQVDFNRFSDHKRNLYDINWNYIPVSYNYPTYPNIVIKKPKKLNEMIEIARLLSKDFPFIRVDLYSIHDKIYFGELTFFPEAGFAKFNPESYDKELGKWLKLPID